MTLRKMRLSAAVTLLCALVLGGLAVADAQQQGGGQQPAQPATSGQDGQPAAPAPGPTGPQQPTFRGGIDVVRVDAFVTDKKGQPVTDLKETDFEILEDGKPQIVDQFKTIRIDGSPVTGEPVRPIRNASDEEQEAQRDDVRLFVFFLDDYHTRDRNAIAVRETLIKFVDTQLRPTDMVAIMYPLQPTRSQMPSHTSKDASTTTSRGTPTSRSTSGCRRSTSRGCAIKSSRGHSRVWR
jgi:hypothetical protein